MLGEVGQGLARPELLQVADAVARDKTIDREIVIEAMEQAIQTAGRRKYGQELEIRAVIDRRSGEIRLSRVRFVTAAAQSAGTHRLESARPAHRRDSEQGMWRSGVRIDPDRELEIRGR